MPRRRPPTRLDGIADAATAIFIRSGFASARVAEVAREAGIGPGTVYLYAEGKDALFDLALRRGFEDPTLFRLRLPHRVPSREETADHLWRCLRNAAHFPLLWVAAESPPPPGAQVIAEVRGIVDELYRWLFRYRKGIELVNRCGTDWPEVARVFHRRFWRGGVRRVGDYLTRRAGEGALASGVDGRAAAPLVVEALAWIAVHRFWAPDPAPLDDETAAATAGILLTRALVAG